MSTLSRAIQRGWERPRWLNHLLYPLALGYGALMRLRRLAYRAGVLARDRLPLPLIVVGNLSIGGVGKTPLVIELVEQLKARGVRCGVISRGYRARRADGDRPREADAGADAAEVGDEPALIARRCRVPVMVGRDRRRSARALLERHRCDVLISDDGFQHLALRRDLDIVVIDGERRFGNGWCLPAGPLREPRSALRCADLVVAVNGDSDGDGEFSMTTRIEHAVRIGANDSDASASRDSDSSANALHDSDSNERALRDSDSDAHALRDFDSNERALRDSNSNARVLCDSDSNEHALCDSDSNTRALRDFVGVPVHAVAGVGNPGRFFRQLAAHGLDVIAHEFPDHHAYAPADFDFADGDSTVLMTEKDAVKCAALVADGAVAGVFWAVPLQVEIAPALMRAVLARVGLESAEGAR
ncbi:MAG: tetraacyldisaccharide 4'-kinase [bacterium]